MREWEAGQTPEDTEITGRDTAEDLAESPDRPENPDWGGGPLVAAIAAPLVLDACSGGGGSSGPSGSTATPTEAQLTQASRFLSQAAIGYSKADITNLATSSVDAWITAQMAMPRSQRCWDFLIANGYAIPANQFNQTGFDPMIWSQLIGSADVLRQRVGLSLLNMLVVSIDGLNTSFRQFAMADYIDRLWDNAFGNYRDILEAISTSVAMASYLTFLNNVKANPTTGAIPDENYARELMQLFTIGLYQLNSDGSLALSGGAAQPTYTQNDISQHARVWTGYTYANSVNTTPDRYLLGLAVDATKHEAGATSFLGISIPAGATAATARKLTLDGLFNHPNTPPFVCRQLIQHMVTSNPSPAYIARVAAKFANNGAGVRGDMKAVIRAILTDSEARDDSQVSSTTFGKLREPVVRLVQWAKAFRVTSPTNLWPFGNTSSASTRLGESPGRAPSVFNWFRPNYTVPGGAIAAGGLVAPEFQITNEPSIIAYVNYMQGLIANGAGEAKPDYSSLSSFAGNTQALLNELNLVLAAGQISDTTLASIKSAVDSVTGGATNQIYAAILLVMASPQYLVQR